jgi:hypothetical protein
MRKAPDEAKARKFFVILFIPSLIFCFGSLFLFAFKTTNPIFTTDIIAPEIFGQYGDFIGGILGTLLSFLTVYFLYTAYMSQKRELEYAKESLSHEKNDSTFFNMLSSLRDIVNSMHGTFKVRNPSNDKVEIKEFRGREYFQEAIKNFAEEFTYENLSDISKLIYNPETGKLHTYEHVRSDSHDEQGNEGFTRIIVPSPSIRIEVTKPEIAEGVASFFGLQENSLDHYLRFIKSFIDFIASVQYDTDRVRYFRLFKAHLSQNEMALIFYFALADGSDFYRIVDKWNVLDQISNKSLLVDEWHHWHYPLTDFSFLSSRELEEKRIYRDKLTNSL